jgi:hypothetical protein
MSGNLVDVTEVESAPKFKNSYYINVSLLKRGCRITSFWTLQRMFKVSTLNFHAVTDYRDHTSSYYDHWGCFPWFRRKCPPRILSKCGSGGCGSLMVYTWLCCTTFSLAVRIFLNNIVPKQLTRYGGPTACSVPSLVLYLLDFYVWEHPKSTVYAIEVSDFQDFKQWTQNGFDMIGSIGDIL